MFNKELVNKTDELIKEKFPIIYEYKFDGIVFLFGGAVRSLIMGEQIKDLDFVILTQNECQIKDFIKKFKLKYSLSALGGYKINFNNFYVDMFSTNDLLDAVRYDIDMLFYDIQIHQFISCGAIKSIENAKITEINTYRKPLYYEMNRIKKLIKFIKYIYPEKKKVVVKENKLLWCYKMFLEILKHPSKIKKLFMR